MVINLFPKAIYFDTNALRKAGLKFDASWFLETRTKSESYGIPLFTICVCKNELMYAIFDRIAISSQQLNSACSTLSNHTGLKINVDCPELEKCNTEALRLTENRLSKVGIEVIDHHSPDIRQLVIDAVNKKPPFESNDKGFRDTIIVETICEHAASISECGEIWLITEDQVFQKSQERFKSRTVSTVIVNPNELANMISSRAQSLGLMKLEEISTALTTFARDNKQQIAESIDNLEIKVSSLKLYGYESGRPTILNVRSISLARVMNAYPPLEQLKKSYKPGRFDFNITIELKVEVEIERTVGGFGFGLLIGEEVTAKPSVLRDEGPAFTQKDDTPIMPYQKIKEIDTVLTKKTLHAKVTRTDQNEHPIFTDLEILSVDGNGILDI